MNPAPVCVCVWWDKNWPNLRRRLGAMTKSTDQAYWPVARHARPILADPTFIPLASHISAVRIALNALASRRNLIVIYGPAGSGRTTVARQIARLASVRPIVIHKPPTQISLLEHQFQEHLPCLRHHKSQLFVFDSIHLDHTQWPWWLRSKTSESNQFLVVSTTAWWIDNQQCLKDHAVGVGLKLLTPHESAHLSNALLWIKQPLATSLTNHYLDAVDQHSEGLARKVVEFPNHSKNCN